MNNKDRKFNYEHCEWLLTLAKLHFNYLNFLCIFSKSTCISALFSSLCCFWWNWLAQRPKRNVRFFPFCFNENRLFDSNCLLNLICSIRRWSISVLWNLWISPTISRPWSSPRSLSWPSPSSPSPSWKWLWFRLVNRQNDTNSNVLECNYRTCFNWFFLLK